MGWFYHKESKQLSYAYFTRIIWNDTLASVHTIYKNHLSFSLTEFTVFKLAGVDKPLGKSMIFFKESQTEFYFFNKI